MKSFALFVFLVSSIFTCEARFESRDYLVFLKQKGIIADELAAQASSSSSSSSQAVSVEQEETAAAAAALPELEARSGAGGVAFTSSSSSSLAPQPHALSAARAVTLLSKGVLSNHRMLGPYEKTKKEKERDFTADRGVDAYSRLLKVLFPSANGTFNPGQTSPANFSYFIVKLKDSGHFEDKVVPIVIFFLKHALKVELRGGIDKEIPKSLMSPQDTVWANILSSVADKGKREVKKSRNRAINHILKGITEAVKEELEGKSFQPRGQTFDTVLAYFLEFLNEPEEYNQFYEQALRDGEFVQLLIDSGRTEALVEDQAWGLYVSQVDRSNIPLTPGQDPVSNGYSEAYKFDPSSNAQELLEDHFFPDCVETALRQFIGLLLWDYEKGGFSQELINKLPPNLAKFISEWDVGAFNNGSTDFRTQWNRFIGNLNLKSQAKQLTASPSSSSSSSSSQESQSQADTSAAGTAAAPATENFREVIHPPVKYRHKKRTTEYEVASGHLNFLNVLSRLTGIPLDKSLTDIKTEDDIVNAYRDFAIKLNPSFSSVSVSGEGLIKQFSEFYEKTVFEVPMSDGSTFSFKLHSGGKHTQLTKINLRDNASIKAEEIYSQVSKQVSMNNKLEDDSIIKALVPYLNLYRKFEKHKSFYFEFFAEVSEGAPHVNEIVRRHSIGILNNFLEGKEIDRRILYTLNNLLETPALLETTSDIFNGFLGKLASLSDEDFNMLVSYGQKIDLFPKIHVRFSSSRELNERMVQSLKLMQGTALRSLEIDANTKARKGRVPHVALNLSVNLGSFPSLEKVSINMGNADVSFSKATVASSSDSSSSSSSSSHSQGGATASTAAAVSVSSGAGGKSIIAEERLSPAENASLPLIQHISIGEKPYDGSLKEFIVNFGKHQASLDLDNAPSSDRLSLISEVNYGEKVPVSKVKFSPSNEKSFKDLSISMPKTTGFEGKYFYERTDKTGKLKHTSLDKGLPQASNKGQRFRDFRTYMGRQRKGIYMGNGVYSDPSSLGGNIVVEGLYHLRSLEKISIKGVSTDTLDLTTAAISDVGLYDVTIGELKVPKSCKRLDVFAAMFGEILNLHEATGLEYLRLDRAKFLELSLPAGLPLKKLDLKIGSHVKGNPLLPDLNISTFKDLEDLLYSSFNREEGFIHDNIALRFSSDQDKLKIVRLYTPPGSAQGILTLPNLEKLELGFSGSEFSIVKGIEGMSLDKSNPGSLTFPTSLINVSIGPFPIKEIRNLRELVKLEELYVSTSVFEKAEFTPDLENLRQINFVGTQNLKVFTGMHNLPRLEKLSVGRSLGPVVGIDIDEKGERAPIFLHPRAESQYIGTHYLLSKGSIGNLAELGEETQEIDLSLHYRDIIETIEQGLATIHIRGRRTQ